MVSCSLCRGQKQSSIDIFRTNLEEKNSSVEVRFSGSVMLSTMGAGLTFPAIWIENRIKIEPIVGFFWENFTADGYDAFPAGGIRSFYYFKKQPRSTISVPSAYLGLGTMTNEIAFGDQYSNITFSGLIAGYSFVLSPVVQLSPEIMVGLDEDTDIRPSEGVNVVINFFR